VLLDFHGTIAQVEDPVRWVTSAASSLGAALDRGRATVLADRLTTAGRAGGPKPHRVPAHLAEVWAERDLSVAAHRAAYEGLAATVDADLAEALYDRLLIADGWQLYADTIPTLQALRERGVPVAVVSNIGFDLRDLAGQLGFADLVDEFVLSYVLRGGPLQTGSRHLLEGLRGAAHRSGADPDGRRQPRGRRRRRRGLQRPRHPGE
jgi:FMN phosphatase YigB (HAD superfamily)